MENKDKIGRDVFIDPALEKEMGEHLARIRMGYDLSDDKMDRIRKECPMCGGRERITKELPDGTKKHYACLCKEVYYRTVYFGPMLNFIRFPLDEMDKPPVLESLPRIVLFKGDLLDVRHINYLLYRAIRINYYDPYRAENRRPPEIKSGVVSSLVEATVQKSENFDAMFGAYLMYFNLCDVSVFSKEQGYLYNAILRDFINTKYQSNKAVWLFQSTKRDNHWEGLDEFVRTIGRVVEFKSNVAPIITMQNQTSIPKGNSDLENECALRPSKPIVPIGNPKG